MIQQNIDEYTTRYTEEQRTARVVEHIGGRASVWRYVSGLAIGGPIRYRFACDAHSAAQNFVHKDYEGRLTSMPVS